MMHGRLDRATDSSSTTQQNNQLQMVLTSWHVLTVCYINLTAIRVYITKLLRGL